MKPYRKGRFTCRDKKTQEEMQAIVYSDGSCIIGLDVWRLLDKHDTCSYPYEKYKTMADALQKVEITRTPKAYYLPPQTH